MNLKSLFSKRELLMLYRAYWISDQITNIDSFLKNNDILLEQNTIDIFLGDDENFIKTFFPGDSSISKDVYNFNIKYFKSYVHGFFSIAQEIKKSKPKRVVEAYCGLAPVSLFLHKLLKNVEVNAFDNNSEVIKLAQLVNNYFGNNTNFSTESVNYWSENYKGDALIVGTFSFDFFCLNSVIQVAKKTDSSIYLFGTPEQHRQSNLAHVFQDRELERQIWCYNNSQFYELIVAKSPKK